ncbi:putative membrane protein YdjX (TVP38/TMEM64 family) [Paenibacillus castaneae]|uniref:TVP38/TMEM64 family protein n=1 Tax=Paenibacillus castaneae TaxID=474957 RepID=UPI00141B082A|nr:VTT domain-containing protein [Paenibacillus castaneae]NIK79552.1 putative membrane protein YdjX (TVP38/TMEM64 family) [Paenibacillus castaneae]
MILNFDPEQLLELAQDNIPLLLLITFLLMIVQNAFSVFPLLLLITINISIFGSFYGYLWSWFSSVAGAAVTFFIVRNGLQVFSKKKIARKLIKQIENNEFYFVFLMRIFPLLPNSIINIAVGMSAVKLKWFFYGTILGNMIYIFILTLIPIGLMSEGVGFYLIIMMIILFVMGVIIWRRYNKKKKQSHGL